MATIKTVEATNGPTVFVIKSKQWWIKIVGMLQHNWALIEEQVDGAATIYFFHDCGTTRNFVPNYKWHQLKERAAVVDSLSYASTNAATEALQQNGFRLQETVGLLGSGEIPTGDFYDARATEEGVYSKSDEHWKK
jgi:hypothetical protein